MAQIGRGHLVGPALDPRLQRGHRLLCFGRRLDLHLLVHLALRRDRAGGVIGDVEADPELVLLHLGDPRGDDDAVVSADLGDRDRQLVPVDLGRLAHILQLQLFQHPGDRADGAIGLRHHAFGQRVVGQLQCRAGLGSPDRNRLAGLVADRDEADAGLAEIGQVLVDPVGRIVVDGDVARRLPGALFAGLAVVGGARPEAAARGLADEQLGQRLVVRADDRDELRCGVLVREIAQIEPLVEIGAVGLGLQNLHAGKTDEDFLHLVRIGRIAAAFLDVPAVLIARDGKRALLARDGDGAHVVDRFGEVRQHELAAARDFGELVGGLGRDRRHDRNRGDAGEDQEVPFAHGSSPQPTAIAWRRRRRRRRIRPMKAAKIAIASGTAAIV